MAATKDARHIRQRIALFASWSRGKMGPSREIGSYPQRMEL